MSQFSDFIFEGHKVLIRVDFNVPLDKQTLAITDDTRIRAALPTIKKILTDGGSVILMSHLGRPKDGPEDKYSLKHIVDHLHALLNDFAHEHHVHVPVSFAADCIGNEAFLKAQTIEPGEVLVLENLRFYKEEEKGDAAFAEKLSKLGDILAIFF